MPLLESGKSPISEPSRIILSEVVICFVLNSYLKETHSRMKTATCKPGNLNDGINLDSKPMLIICRMTIQLKSNIIVAEKTTHHKRCR